MAHVIPVLPEIVVTLANKPLDLLKISIEEIDTQQALNQIAQAHVVLSGRENDMLALLSSDLADAEVKISVKTAVQTFVIFAGQVIEQELFISLGNARLTLDLRHCLYRLRQTMRSQVFSQQSDLDIFKKIFNHHQITLKEAFGLTLKYPQMVQYQCSDWQFLQYRLNANSVWLVTREDQVALVDAKIPAGTVKASHLMQREENYTNPGLVSTKWQQRLPAHNSDVKAASWDIDQQKMTAGRKAKALDLATGGVDTRSLKAGQSSIVELNYGLALEEAEIEARINALELQRQLSSLQAQFIVWGGENYQVGESLEVKGFGKLMDGKGIISEVRHVFRPDKWETTLQIGQEAASLVKDLTPAIRGVHIGIVEKYLPDDKKWFRLQVNVPSLNNNDALLWARMALPYASDDGSVAFYPNPGDEVLLAFLEDDPRYPIVLGAMHNPKKPPPIEFNDKSVNDKKYVCFTKDNKQYQMVFDVKESAVQLTADRDAVLLGKGIDLKLDKLSVFKAEEDVKRNPQGEVINVVKTTLEMKSQDITIAGEKSITVSSKKIDLKK